MLLFSTKDILFYSILLGELRCRWHGEGENFFSKLWLNRTGTFSFGVNPVQPLSLTVPFLFPWGSVTALGGQDRGRWVRLLSRKHHLRWVVGVCSRINTAEGAASLIISPKKTTDKPELCVVSLDLFTGLRVFFFKLFGEDCAYYAPERYRFNSWNPKRSELICAVSYGCTSDYIICLYHGSKWWF